MTPAQHRALERIVEAEEAGTGLWLGESNTAETVAKPTADALVRRDLAWLHDHDDYDTVFVRPTRAGFDLCRHSEPIKATR